MANSWTGWNFADNNNNTLAPEGHGTYIVGINCGRVLECRIGSP